MLDYSPQYLHSVKAILETHESSLKKLIGKKLTESWIVWENGEDEWFCDAPIILNFEGKMLELNHFKFDDLSITFNHLNVSSKPNWFTFKDVYEPDLEWRKDGLTELADMKGSKLLKLGLSEYLLQTQVVQSKQNPETVGQKDESWLLSGVCFWFEAGYLSVYNGLDENAVTSQYSEENLRYSLIAV